MRGKSALAGETGCRILAFPKGLTRLCLLFSGVGRVGCWFRNIVNMLHGVRDGLVRDANNYEQQEQASQQILSS